MPKAVLSNRIFLEVTLEQEEHIRKSLTYKIPNPRTNEPPIIIRNMGRFRDGIVTMPIGRLDLIPKGHEIVDKRVSVPQDFPDFAGVLRDSQQEIYDELEDNALINAFVSFGKTFTALAIAGKLRQKTLVVVHTIGLRNQWEKEVEKVYGFKPGIIGSGQFNTSTPIVLANVQTMSKHMDKIKDVFGLVILDEVHHVSAATFSNIMDKSTARFKIGLSGTLKRKDGKHVVFKDYFGPKVFMPPAENYMEPVIHIYKPDARLPDAKSLSWAEKVNILTADEEYQHFIAIVAASYVAQGHSVLVVADRVKFLEICADLTGDYAECVTGTVKDSERQASLARVASGESKILFGTQSMFSEGISLNRLSCLILATPLNNAPLLTQLIGRVIREHDNKLQPVIVDVNLQGGTAKRQAAARIGVYMQHGWKIKNVSY